jgi:hypothetical protein
VPVVRGVVAARGLVWEGAGRPRLTAGAGRAVGELALCHMVRSRAPPPWHLPMPHARLYSRDHRGSSAAAGVRNSAYGAHSAVAGRLPGRKHARPVRPQRHPRRSRPSLHRSHEDRRRPDMRGVLEARRAPRCVTNTRSEGTQTGVSGGAQAGADLAGAHAAARHDARRARAGAGEGTGSGSEESRAPTRGDMCCCCAGT